MCDSVLGQSEEGTEVQEASHERRPPLPTLPRADCQGLPHPLPPTLFTTQRHNFTKAWDVRITQVEEVHYPNEWHGKADYAIIPSHI